jgi:hypothetical protein
MKICNPLDFYGKMSYGDSPHSFKKLPLFISNVGLISNHADASLALKSNNSILLLLIFSTFFLHAFFLAIDGATFA